MVSFPNFGAVPFSWFAVLPDADLARPVGTVLGIHASQQISHVSGRPWLLGCWSKDAVTVGEARQTKIAMMGQHAMTSAKLTEVANRTSTVADLDRLAKSLVGSSHLVASVAGRVRAQGTVTGVRRVFHTCCDGAVIASDRADVLAWLLDAPLDQDRLAVYLLDPLVLYPFAGQTVWQGVELLQCDHYLALDNEGRHRQVKWWSPPDPVVPLAEGVPALRDALSAAVAIRVRGRELVSCDLSGLDSTAVCCMAAHDEAKVVAYTAASRDPLDDDVYWATRTVAELGNVEHHVIPEAQMPLVYHGLQGMEDQLDEPCAAAVDRDRWLIIARRAAARGSPLHLTGFGGDELLYGSLAHLHSLLRTHPVLAKRLLRGFTATYRWPWKRTMRQLWDRSNYSEWLTRVSDDLTKPPAPLEEPRLDWGLQPRLPPWVTAAGVDAVRTLIRTTVPNIQPLAKGRGQHQELEMMRFGSGVVRQLDQMAARFGVTLAAPYYDDRVIEAGLTVCPQERITPWQYKPLITEAMRGIVPEASRTRQTKADGTCNEDTGLRQNRADLLALWEDSRLAQLGLIDAVALREMCTRPMPSHLQIGVLYQTVACEMWLRTLHGATTAS